MAAEVETPLTQRLADLDDLIQKCVEHSSDDERVANLLLSLEYIKKPENRDDEYISNLVRLESLAKERLDEIESESEKEETKHEYMDVAEDDRLQKGNYKKEFGKSSPYDGWEVEEIHPKPDSKVRWYSIRRKGWLGKVVYNAGNPHPYNDYNKHVSLFYDGCLKETVDAYKIDGKWSNLELDFFRDTSKPPGENKWPVYYERGALEPEHEKDTGLSKDQKKELNRAKNVRKFKGE